ncbi:hypothetical protein B5807_04191 [Epicoccum nigrum]|uniref:Uncharacterized protein n=1 Tax=Epicoccum nigrum TaxID=105696 RepID=A0A1Y2M549_EPING|nr:hypothetical protein B5807_04191 [Epicoccum nigrum]
MVLTARPTPSLSSQTSFCPPPLHIQKKPRKATFRRRNFRKSTHCRPINSYVNGPLDDIIDEIRSNIWESPHDYSAEAPLLGWAASLEVPPSWTVTPLPVSRLPSNQPLTVRKNRESRSSASDSSMGEHTQQMRKSVHKDALDGGPVGLPGTDMASWLLLETPAPYETAQTSSLTNANTTDMQEASRSTMHSTEGLKLTNKRRPSVLRLFTGLSRLRRTNTSENSGGGGDMPDLWLPTVFPDHNEDEEGDALPEPSEDAVESYIQKHARK